MDFLPFAVKINFSVHLFTEEIFIINFCEHLFTEEIFTISFLFKHLFTEETFIIHICEYLFPVKDIYIYIQNITYKRMNDISSVLKHLVIKYTTLSHIERPKNVL